MDYTYIRMCQKEKKRSDRIKQVKMQNIKYALLLLTMLIGVGIVGNSELDIKANAKVESESQTYAKHCIVTKLDYANDVVTCEDVNGFEWEFEGVEDLDLGDIVALVMDSKGTQIIFDDSIVNSKYDGYLALWSERGFN